MKNSILFSALLLVIFLILVWQQPQKTAEPPIVLEIVPEECLSGTPLYASVDGMGAACSRKEPCSLETAHEMVTHGQCILLGEGTYLATEEK